MTMGSSQCNDAGIRWLATIDSNEKLKVSYTLGALGDVCFGLRKISTCKQSGCNSKLSWETNDNVPLSTANYTVNC
jgi:hypothetical protein